MTRNTLQFVHSSRPPDAELRVFDSLTREFLGTEFTFRVIGSSHFVGAPAYDFYELSSCDAVDVDGATTIRLDAPRTTDGPSRTIEGAPGTADGPPRTADGEGRSSDGEGRSTDDRFESTDRPTRTANGDRTDGRGEATHRIVYETDSLRCRTLVERRPLAAFPGAESADLAYEFDEDAVTTVDVGTDAYETYHTYPEFDLALFTRTVFEAVPPGATPVDGVVTPPTD